MLTSFFKINNKLALLATTTFVFANSSYADDLAKGKELYNGMGGCAACHGATGSGDGAAAAALNPKPRNFTSADFLYDTDGDGKKGTEDDIFNIITNGAAKYNGAPTMIAYQHLSEADRRAIAKYVFSLHTPAK